MGRKFLILLTILLQAGVAFAAPDSENLNGDDSKSDGQILQLVKSGLAKKYAEARIDLNGTIHWTRGDAPSSVRSVRLINESPQAQSFFSVQGKDNEYSEGWISFAAWVPARVALRRARPGETLEASNFVFQDVNVATGEAREYRGVLFPGDRTIAGIQTRQTILEGQFLTTSAVEQIPDVKRGDAVQVHLISGDMTLTTSGTIEEPGFVNGQVHVMASKNKRELMGMLKPNGVVEVRL